MPRVAQPNSDLEIISPQEVQAPYNSADVIKDTGPDVKIHKKIIRRAQDDGFFQTGVDVIEDEAIDYEQTAKNAAELLNTGNYSAH